MDKYCVIRFEGKDDYDGAKVYGYYPTEEDARKAASDAYDENPGDAFDVCPLENDGTPDYGNTVISFGWDNCIVYRIWIRKHGEWEDCDTACDSMEQAWNTLVRYANEDTSITGIRVTDQDGNILEEEEL